MSLWRRSRRIVREPEKSADLASNDALKQELETCRRKAEALEDKLRTARVESVDELLDSISQGVCYGSLQVRLLASGQDVLLKDIAKSIDILIESLINKGARIIGAPGDIVEFDSNVHAGSAGPQTEGNRVRIAVPGLLSPSGTVIRKAVTTRLA